jgi:hypothetical protein
MASKKKKQVVWHKKQGKIMPASVLKPHSHVPSATAAPISTTGPAKDKLKIFANKLSEQIKKAVSQQDNEVSS